MIVPPELLILDDRELLEDEGVSDRGYCCGLCVDQFVEDCG